MLIEVLNFPIRYHIGLISVVLHSLGCKTGTLMGPAFMTPHFHMFTQFYHTEMMYVRHFHLFSVQVSTSEAVVAISIYWWLG